MIFSLLATLIAYLVGSLSFAVIVSRAMGLSDPRTYGSGNPGATNVLRSGSKPAAIVTLLLDAAKGWLPVMLVKWFGPAWDLSEGTQALAGLAGGVGHRYPVVSPVKGGKGGAAGVGGLLAFEPLLALATMVTFAIIVFFSRYVSLASMVAAVFAPAYYLIGDGVAWTASGAKTLALIAMGLLLIWRHRENIQRLLAGTESKLGARKK